jgi:hypothetical protein
VAHLIITTADISAAAASRERGDRSEETVEESGDEVAPLSAALMAAARRAAMVCSEAESASDRSSADAAMLQMALVSLELSLARRRG